MPHPPHTHSHSQILPQESLFHKPKFHSPLTPITKLSSELHQPILGSHSNRMKKKNKIKPPSFKVSHGFKPQFSTYHFYDPRQSIYPKHFLSQGQEGRNQRREISPALRKPLILCTSFHIQLSPHSSVRASRLLQLFYEVTHGGSFTNLNSELLRIGTRSSVHASNF